MPNKPRPPPTRSRRRSDQAVTAMRPQPMSTNTKLTAGLLSVVLVGLVALFVFVQRCGCRTSHPPWSWPLLLAAQ